MLYESPRKGAVKDRDFGLVGLYVKGMFQEKDSFQRRRVMKEAEAKTR